ncbi:MAG: hypothetical protein ACRAVC_18280 [Trichormus sp.]
MSFTELTANNIYDEVNNCNIYILSIFAAVKLVHSSRLDCAMFGIA